MPPRHAYWTIIVDNQATAFRAHDQEELLPTFNRLKEKNASVEMKWFERGQLFDSRDAARSEGLGEGERRWEGPRGGKESSKFKVQSSKPDRRDKTWRPGGEHRDPRQKYADAKKAKWQRFKQKIRGRHEDRDAREAGASEPDVRRAGASAPARADRGDSPESFTPPHGDKLRPEGPRATERPRGPAGEGRPPKFDRPREEWRGKPSRPHGDKFREPRADWRDRPPRREDDRRESRPPRAEWRDDRRDSRPPRPEWRDDRRDSRPPRPEWRDRPPRRDEDRPRRDDDRRDSRSARPEWRDDRRDAPRSRDRAPRDDRRESRPSRPEWRDRPPRRDEDRPPRRGDDRGKKPWGGKPAGGGARKPWGAKPAGRGGPRKPWGAKPGGAAAPRKPWGAKPGNSSGARKPWGAKKRRDEED